MENSFIQSGKKGVGRVFRICLVVVLLFSLTISKLSAQDGGPSLENLSKNATAATQEMERLKAEERKREILSYVYMTVGFSIVIGIAWFTTVMARKRSRKEQEEKQRFILKQQELRKHGHHHHHGHLHKARR